MSETLYQRKSRDPQSPESGSQRFLRPDQRRLLDLLQEMTVREVAGVLGVDRRTVWARVVSIIRILEAAGHDPSAVRALIRPRRGRMIPLSGLRGADRSAAARCFGEGDLAPATFSNRRVRAAFSARLGSSRLH